MPALPRTPKARPRGYHTHMDRVMADSDARPVLVLGAGGHGRVVVQALRSAGRIVAGFLDDDRARVGTQVDGCGVLGTSEDAPRLVAEFGAALIVGIGDNAQRAKRQRGFEAGGLPLTVAIDHSAVVAPEVEIGAGSVILPGAVVNTGSRLGAGCVVNTSASLDHDTVLGDYVHLSPGVITSGGVSVGGYAWLGAGAIVMPGLNVGERAVVGAGALVREDVEPGATVVGVPARPLEPGS